MRLILGLFALAAFLPMTQTATAWGTPHPIPWSWGFELTAVPNRGPRYDINYEQSLDLIRNVTQAIQCTSQPSLFLSSAQYCGKAMPGSPDPGLAGTIDGDPNSPYFYSSPTRRYTIHEDDGAIEVSTAAFSDQSLKQAGTGPFPPLDAVFQAFARNHLHPEVAAGGTWGGGGHMHVGAEPFRKTPGLLREVVILLRTTGILVNVFQEWGDDQSLSPEQLFTQPLQALGGVIKKQIPKEDESGVTDGRRVLLDHHPINYRTYLRAIDELDRSILDGTATLDREVLQLQGVTEEAVAKFLRLKRPVVSSDFSTWLGFELFSDIALQRAHSAYRMRWTTGEQDTIEFRAFRAPKSTTEILQRVRMLREIMDFCRARRAQRAPLIDNRQVNDEVLRRTFSQETESFVEKTKRETKVPLLSHPDFTLDWIGHFQGYNVILAAKQSSKSSISIHFAPGLVESRTFQVLSPDRQNHLFLVPQDFEVRLYNPRLKRREAHAVQLGDGTPGQRKIRLLTECELLLSERHKDWITLAP